MKDRAKTPTDASCVYCIAKIIIETLKAKPDWVNVTCDLCETTGLKEIPWSEL